MDLKRTFDNICAVPGSQGAVMIRDDGEIARASGELRDIDDAYALSNLMKDAAQLISIVRPDVKTITRATLLNQDGTSIVLTPHQGHVFGVKLAGLTEAAAVGGNKGLSVSPPPPLVNPAKMAASAQQAYASSLYPGRSLSPGDIQLIIEQESYKIQHQGHEGKHALMFLIFVCVLATLPSTVTYWRQRHPMSYRLVSIGSICLIPVYFAAANHYYRFVWIWLVYALANTYVLYVATRSPLHARTPRRVYRWFAFINKASYAVFVAGGLLFLLGFFNIMPGLTDTDYYIETSMLTVFYGLYFGLMSRDLVTLCTDRMVTTLGYSSRGTRLPTKSLPRDVCCICGDRLGGRGNEAASAGGMLAATSTSGSPARHGGSAAVDAVTAEPTHALGCGHEFHASCIRGWCVIGKKDVCPFCSEKVDLQEFKRNPWDKQELFYVTALEYMRFFVSWQPLTLLFLTAIFWLLGLN
ncbi:hypothetical protein LPJ59_003166 [Coemansia sp. RSA 2399]|nr:hypothetical protein LPJ59_003166 [Coemansia sp. RSA 2399]